jgi:NAD(P)-dependent dehydrogenase (short-subunit alcohol dehydrogenase family)
MPRLAGKVAFITGAASGSGGGRDAVSDSGEAVMVWLVVRPAGRNE